MDAVEPDRHPAAVRSARRRTSWTFLSNHARVLACLADDPTIRLRDVAGLVGITERAAQSIVADLAAAGCVTRRRIGRRNCYEIHRDVHMRYDATHDLSVGDLLDFLALRTVQVESRPPAPDRSPWSAPLPPAEAPVGVVGAG
jgi:hypothetical protein